MGGVLYDAEFLEEAEDLFITHATAQPGEMENVVTRETLVKMVKELATNTHPEDKQRPTTREEFILLCQQVT
jgi:hypothetical protein